MEVERLQAVLEATGIAAFAANMKEADSLTSGLRDKLASLDASSRVAANAVNKIRITAAQAAESGASADFLKAALRKIGAQAEIVEAQLGHVKMTARQAVESKAAAEGISEGLSQVSRDADQAKRKLEEVRLAGGRNGVGFGPIGSGFGRVGLVGSAVGAGVLSTPALGPAALGVLAAIPAMVTTAAGALGTLALAFHGVDAAIGGSKQAFDKLSPPAQQFVLTVRSLTGFMHELEQTAQHAMFPGLTAALHDALSPSTVAAVTRALQEFGSAIGEAAQIWGRYFGSSQFANIFGSVMQQGVRSLKGLSSAALSLFDALGRFTAAAAPFEQWLVTSTANGAKWLDTFVQAKAVTGGLQSALDSARSSLTVAGDLVAAVAKAIGSLGVALYPVSKVAVKDLTDGLDALAQIIDRNRAGIQNVVSGALQALVSTVRIAYPVVELLAKGLSNVASNIGGWKIAFELVLAGTLAAKLGTLVEKLRGVATTLGLIPAAAKKATAETDTQLSLMAAEAETTSGKIAGIKAALTTIAGTVVTAAILLSIVPKSSTGQTVLDKAGLGFLGHAPVVGGAISQSAALGYRLGGGNAAGLNGQSGPQNNLFGSPLQQLAPGGLGPLGGVLKAGTTAAMRQQALQQQMQAINGASGGWNPNAQLAYQMALSAGLSPAQAQDFAAVQYGESGFNANARNKKSGAAGLYQLLSSGYVNRANQLGGVFDPTANIAAILPNYVAYYKSHPTLVPGAAGAAVEASGEPASYYAAGYAHLGDMGSPSAATSPFGARPPYKPTAAESSAAKAAAALKQQLATLRASLNTESTKITNDFQASLLPPSVAGDLQTKVLSISTALDSATKKAIPGIRTSLSALKAAVSTGLKQGWGDTPDLSIDPFRYRPSTNAIAIQGSSAYTGPTGAALLPASLRSKLSTLTGRFQATSAVASVMVGQAAQAYADALRGNLENQSSVLTKQAANLKSQLKLAAPTRAAAIQKELTAVQSQLKDVQSQIVQSLQANVQTMQQKVGTLFSSVASQFDAAFAAQTQSMIDQLAVTFEQNGLQTPLEATLAAMQAQDQLDSLNQAVTDAQTALSQAQTAGGVFDESTGKTTFDVNAPAVAAANQALAAAKRQVEEYNLSIQATAQRTAADKAYTSQVNVLQAQRSAAEDQMNQALANLGAAFQNGVGSMSSLTDIANLYGIQISNVNVPDFANLSTAAKSLQDALGELADYIDNITGSTPAPVTVSAGDMSGTETAISAAVVAAAYAITARGGLPGGLINNYGVGGAYGQKGAVQLHAAGGILTKPTWLGPHDVAGEAGPEAVIPLTDPSARAMLGGGQQLNVQLTVHALDPHSVDWNDIGDQAADGLYHALLKKRRRVGPLGLD